MLFGSSVDFVYLCIRPYSTWPSAIVETKYLSWEFKITCLLAAPTLWQNVCTYSFLFGQHGVLFIMFRFFVLLFLNTHTLIYLKAFNEDCKRNSYKTDRKCINPVYICFRLQLLLSLQYLYDMIIN